MVRFSAVEIIELPIIIGDNPSLSSGGPPMAVGWKAMRRSEFALDFYEKYRTKRRATRRDLIVSNTGRTNFFLKCGYALEEIEEAAAIALNYKNQMTITKLLSNRKFGLDDAAKDRFSNGEMVQMGKYNRSAAAAVAQSSVADREATLDRFASTSSGSRRVNDDDSVSVPRRPSNESAGRGGPVAPTRVASPKILTRKNSPTAETLPYNTNTTGTQPIHRRLSPPTGAATSTFSSGSPSPSSSGHHHQHLLPPTRLPPPAGPIGRKIISHHTNHTKDKQDEKPNVLLRYHSGPVACSQPLTLPCRSPSPQVPTILRKKSTKSNLAASTPAAMAPPAGPCSNTSRTFPHPKRRVSPPPPPSSSPPMAGITAISWHTKHAKGWGSPSMASPILPRRKRSPPSEGQKGLSLMRSF